MTSSPDRTPPSSARSSAPAVADADRIARLRLALARLARLQRQASTSGLTPSQQSALAVIDRRGPITLGELARVEQVAPPTITRIIAKLEDQGLVGRRVDRLDRRVARLSITTEGHTRLERARERRNQWLAERLADLDGRDVDAILAAIEPLERLAAGPGDETNGEPERAR